nr:MAG TPA: hypothetical protein [Bacteriophage sp.]
MYKGTTPTLTFTFTEFDPSSADKLILTFVSGKSKWEFTEADVICDSTSVALTLTQEQTLAFPVGAITAQLNFLMADGSRFVSKPTQFPVEKNLYEEVMS